MAVVNVPQKEISCKIVYYGPGLGGKTTNLEYIAQKNKGREGSGKLISLTTDTDRTLFFDFMPVGLGTVRGYKTRFNLYTVPGQVFFAASRKLILRGVDGVVFVADSQEERMDANEEGLVDLQANLAEYGYDFQSMPYVLQLNKRDLPTAVTEAEMTERLRLKGEPVIPAVATTGQGVFDSFKEAVKLILLELKKG